MSVNSKSILVVEDEQSLRISLFEALNQEGYQVSVAENGAMALDMLQKNPVDLVISDIRMPEMDGLALLQKIKVSYAQLPVVIITGFATVDTAIEAMKKGAYDYILKPFPVEVIKEIAKRVFDTRKNSQIGQAVLEAGGRGPAILEQIKRPAKNSFRRDIIGVDPGWCRMIEKARAVASSTATVLVLGESGTGKEVLARFVHQESDRSDGPFVALNCAALPDGLLESELFGHERGAFTGAVSAKKGKFEMANGGTLLLDEIGEVPMHLQAKLLRVLQEEEVDRLGGKGPIKFDVHVIATTNRNLAEAVEKGEFRLDLFYRLNVIPLRLPALKERNGDILLLAEYFIEKFFQRYKKTVRKLSQLSKNRLLAYAWPGNVREMENMVERAVLLSQGDELEPWDLWDEDDPNYIAPDSVVPVSAGASVDGAGSDQGQQNSSHFFIDDAGQMVPLREAERQMIMQALHKTDNNRTHAAKILGISVRTLRNKLHEYRSKGLIS